MTATDNVRVLAEQLAANPTDTTLRLVYADALDEAGQHGHAVHHRGLARGQAAVDQMFRDLIAAGRYGSGSAREMLTAAECLAVAAVIRWHLGSHAWLENRALLRGLKSIPYVGHMNVSENQRRIHDRFAEEIRRAGASTSNVVGKMQWACVIGHKCV